MQEPQQRQSIDEANSALIRAWIHSQRWDGILLGNLDLIGPELLPALLEAPCILQHHVGFVHPPFPPTAWPVNERYRLVAASEAVRSAMLQPGFPPPVVRGLPRCAVRTVRQGSNMHAYPLAPDGSLSTATQRFASPDY